MNYGSELPESVMQLGILTLQRCKSMDALLSFAVQYPTMQEALAQSEAEQLAVEVNKFWPEGTLNKSIVQLQRMLAMANSVKDTVEELFAARKEILDARQTASEADAEARAATSPDDIESWKALKAQAEEDEQAAIARVLELERQLQEDLLPQDEDDTRNAILEVRPGTGGAEACLFARDMFHAYEKFASNMGWRWTTLDTTVDDDGGYREASASIEGDNVFGWLKFETGVHRVQRIPATETMGRVHTSTMTVAVLPEAEEMDVTIHEKDLRIDVYRSKGAGGQHVNTTDSAVRITHIPTGIVVCMQDERSQHKNRAAAMKVLRSRIYEQRRQKLAAERAAMRQQQVGTGDRNERIRTYNYNQSRVTDHRINFSLHSVEGFMNGELVGALIEKLREADKIDRMKAMANELK